jgi:excisionase family DNA binding protein
MNHNIDGLMNDIKCDAQGALNYLSSAGTPHGTFISIKDAAALLNCSRRFLEIRIEDGELKVFRPSKRLVRIKRSELDRWVERYSTTKGIAS